jgi:hypothetical protein
MSKLVIETYQRDEGALAIAFDQHFGITQAGVCGDQSERRAIIGAIHSYFNRKENNRPAPVLDEPPFSTPPGYATGRIPCGPVTRNVAVDETAITRALREAVEADSSTEFLMDYVDVGGNSTTRRILPVSIDGPLVTAIDLSKDAPRTFRFDRIERLEAV